MSLVRRLTLAATLAVVAVTARAYAEEPARPAWADDVAALRLEGDAAKRVERTWALLAKKPDAAALRAELAPTAGVEGRRAEGRGRRVEAGRGQGRKLTVSAYVPAAYTTEKAWPVLRLHGAVARDEDGGGGGGADGRSAGRCRRDGRVHRPGPLRHAEGHDVVVAGGVAHCARPSRTWPGGTASIPTASRRRASGLGGERRRPPARARSRPVRVFRGRDGPSPDHAPVRRTRIRRELHRAADLGDQRRKGRALSRGRDRSGREGDGGGRHPDQWKSLPEAEHDFGALMTEAQGMLSSCRSTCATPRPSAWTGRRRFPRTTAAARGSKS